MNILYIHGFASRFDPHSSKIVALEKLGSVGGIDLDYTEPVENIFAELEQEISEGEYDLLVGTSLGGYWAAKTGTELGLPFVAVNPSIAPKDNLWEYVGHGVTHFGTEYDLGVDVIRGYEDFPTEGFGLILLDAGDDVIDSTATANALYDSYYVVTYPGGSHRFEHMEEAVEEIDTFIASSMLIG